ncbi:MAG: hypothetical protein KF773_23065 [Deltaproteobacteria bacterium]|nr:hypothetical protein [Deltaproteobacteria bacterium]
MRDISSKAAPGVLARVTPGHPCRATVDGVDVIVGGRPLIADVGATHWQGEDAANGTTFKQNGEPAARIHANQLFDQDGIPVLRVAENGDISDQTARLLRRARQTPEGVRIEGVVDPSIALLVSNTDNLTLAAMLTATREAAPVLRALAACHYLLPDAIKP